MQPNGNNLSHTTYCLCRFTHAGIAHLESRNTGCLPSSNYGGLDYPPSAPSPGSPLSRLPNGCIYVLLHMHRDSVRSAPSTGGNSRGNPTRMIRWRCCWTYA